MNQAQLGEQVAERLIRFADAAHQRGLEPVSFHVGKRQFQALAAWASLGTGISVVQAMKISGIPVWRDERDHYLEVETISTTDASKLEACLNA